MNNRSFGLILISACLLLFLGGCAPILNNDQPAHTSWVTLDNQHSLGQTFTARYAGLQGIAFLVEPVTPITGKLEISLFPINERETPLKTVLLPLEEINSAGFQRIPFRNIPLSNQQDYYVQLTIQGEGKIRVGTGPGDSYLNGAAYRDDVAQDQQIAFRLIYTPSVVGRGLVLEWMGWAFNLSIGFLLFIIPGWGILTTILPDWRSLFWAEKIGLAGGVSVAIYPILILWTNLIGLRLGILNAWLPILAGISLMFWNFANRPHALRAVQKPSLAQILCNLAYLSVLAILLFTRLWPMRGLDAPLWGDSLQHTIISQLIVDHKGLFISWAPYAELTSFTYHFGFHSLSAAFHWMTGMEMSKVVLWTGQIMNVLSLLGLVPLANRLSGSRWAGLFALVSVGLFSSIPQIYINWGRYTQLTGQVILLVFVFLGWVYFRDHPTNRPLAILLAFVLAGLGLTHNRILLFAVAFLLVYLVAYGRSSGGKKLLIALLLTSGLSLVLFLPWLIRIIPSTITELLVAQVNMPAAQLSLSSLQVEKIFQFTTYIPNWLWVLSGAGVLLALWRRDKAMLVVVAWWMVVLLIGNPQWLGLPGSGIIGGFTVMIAAYIPAGLLIGYLSGNMISHLPDPDLQPRLKLLIFVGITILTVFVSLTALRPRLADVQVKTSALFTRADQRAADWIGANLPEDSLILVNSFLAYDNTVAVGSDGGWWLPFKAHRQVTLPPINYSLESGPEPDYRQHVNQITTAILTKGIGDPAVQVLLDERGITHIYLGQQQGSVNYAGPPILPEQLLALDNFYPVYHQDRVWIFERNQP